MALKLFRKILPPFAFFLFLWALVFPPQARAFGIEDIPVFGGIWEKIQCVIDVDCWIENATAALANTVVKINIGKGLDDLTVADLNRMWAGEGEGALFALSRTGDLALQNPPLMPIAQYARYELSQNLLNPQPAFAQTFGTEILSTIADGWRRFRNLAYALLTVVLGITGIMIMWGKEVAPRVTVSLTYALPRVVVGILLITFSYAIAALAIDLLWNFGVDFIYRALAPPELVAADVGTGVLLIFGGAFLRIVVMALAAFALSLTGVGTLASIAIFFLVALGAMALLVVGVAIIFQLLFRYATLLLLTLFGPLFLLIGTLPGQEKATYIWFRSLIISAFAPTAMVAFVLVSQLILGTGAPIEIGEGFGELGFGLFSNLVLAIVSTIVLVMALKAPSVLEKAIPEPR